MPEIEAKTKYSYVSPIINHSITRSIGDNPWAMVSNSYSSTCLNEQCGGFRTNALSPPYSSGSRVPHISPVPFVSGASPVYFSFWSSLLSSLPAFPPQSGHFLFGIEEQTLDSSNCFLSYKISKEIKREEKLCGGYSKICILINYKTNEFSFSWLVFP